MPEPLCQICNSAPKKYKCPTCSILYCSLPCFKLHKPTHENAAAPPPAPTKPSEPNPLLSLPLPPPPPPPPKYLKQKTDFSVLSTNPKFKEVLKANPTLLASLQRVYAATLEPDPESHQSQGYHSSNYRGRGRGRGRGFQRGRGRGGFGGGDQGPPRWNQKKGDNDGLRLIKRFREGKEGGSEGMGMAEFLGLVEECFGRAEKRGDEGGEKMLVG